MRVTNLSVHLAVSLGEPLPRQLADGTGAPPLTTGPRGSRPFNAGPCGPAFTSGISGRFQPLFRIRGQLALALLALPPLSAANIATGNRPFDLHASSTLPAFDLSQNQTLRRIEILRFHSAPFPDRELPFAAQDRAAIAPEFRVCCEFPSTNLLDCRAAPPAPRPADSPRTAWAAQCPKKRFPFQRAAPFGAGVAGPRAPCVFEGV